MASRTFEVARYHISLVRDIVNFPGIHAYVRCVGQNNELFDIFFYLPNILPKDNETNINEQEPGAYGIYGTSYLPASEYVWYVDLLRNEHPTFVTIDDQYPGRNGISCREPAGEGETFFRPPE